MKIIQLSTEDWDSFRRHKDFRDECCMKIGVLEYESQVLRQRYMDQIKQSIREEEAEAKEISSKYGIKDSDHWRIEDAEIMISD